MDLILSQEQGLTAESVRTRLASHGYNELPSAKQKTWLRLLLDVLQEPMFLLLIACAILYLFVGDLLEGLVLFGAVLVIIAIELFQERRTERTLAALRDLATPPATVVRDGVRIKVARREVVPGDIIVLLEGDRVPADAIVIGGQHLLADESLLTGESVAVEKHHQSKAEQGDHVYSGTLIVRGQGMASVVATGAQTELGKIGKSIQTIDRARTPLQRTTRRLVLLFAFVGLVLCALVAILFGISRGDWIQGVLAGITAAISLIPEEFPVILTIFLALAAWKMARNKVLVRRMPALEALGAATYICVDKTGTITQNKMGVKKVAVGERVFDVEANPSEVAEVLKIARLASAEEPFDPMEVAVKDATDFDFDESGHEAVRQYPLSALLMAVTHVWKQPDGSVIVACKGAPEAVIELCRSSDAQRQTMMQHVDQLARQGYRILAVASGMHESPSLPESPHGFDLELLGLLALSDPVREEVPKALDECYAAGIQVAMITGDFPETALSIARQAGLRNSSPVITGKDLDSMSDDEVNRVIESTTIFARVTPAHKLRIVQSLKARGEVVAMTGDGVNDAPALKAADVGIAMGKRGTDVAREAADLVLVEDDFASIVEAVRSGRNVYDNIQRAMLYVMAVHVPIAIAALLPVLFGWPLILMPVHVLLLELIIDPASSTIFTAVPEQSDVMIRGPRPVNQPPITAGAAVTNLLVGLAAGAAPIGVFLISQRLGFSEGQSRALTYVALLGANAGLLISYLCWPRTVYSSSKPLLRLATPILIVVLVAISLFVALPGVDLVFHFKPVSALEAFLSLLTGLAVIAATDLAKFLAALAGQRNPQPNT